jgi:hypothetical protein
MVEYVPKYMILWCILFLFYFIATPIDQTCLLHPTVKVFILLTRDVDREEHGVSISGSPVMHLLFSITTSEDIILGVPNECVPTAYVTHP